MRPPSSFVNRARARVIPCLRGEVARLAQVLNPAEKDLDDAVCGSGGVSWEFWFRISH